MIYFIVNPKAGSGKAKAAVPIIEKIMREHNTEYSLIYTETPDDFMRLLHAELCGFPEPVKPMVL